ncbi:uncharacterized protein LOC129914732 [Episyrphus balteatus]|uniref:uncharacterized protein LOC129914732 n=1 Tax=Episyrphus balteatus TaxID=286459 RepID=UPI0024852912|nr:uncharacterized protein LOC129914732 [Episyrphus balteatus]
MFCATFNNSQLSYNIKLSHMIAVFFAWSLCIAVSQAHLILNDHEQYRARPPPINPNHQLDQRSPSEVMVDLSNDLSFKILHLHSILNRNNFAFSPTALMCVLVALYEGSAGRSSLEMRNCLPMPNNRDVIRVGYRDIHRRLRTYFFDDENPLKGLSLNKENVTITAEFETVLKFYGYDLGIDMVSSTTTASSNNNNETITTTPVTYLPTAAITDTSALPSTMTTEKITEEPTTTEKSTTTTTTTTPEPTTTTTPEPIKTTTIPETTTLETETTIVSETPQPLSGSTTLEPKEEGVESPSPASQESGEVVTLSNSENESLGEKANFKRFKNNGKLVSQPRLEYLPVKFTPSRTKPFKRTRRHLFGLKGLDPNFFLSFMQPRTQFLQAPPPAEIIEIEAPPPPPPAPVHVQSFSSTSLIQPIDTIPVLPIQNGYFDVEQGFLAQKEELRSEIVDHIFYVNNQDIIHTTFKVYNSVLYYRYFEQMKISILELELDSTDYNLMILLPDYDLDLLTASSNLRLGPTLRSLRKQLKPRWVQAIIPDFELHGTVFLTNDLQNLGVCDIFEPNRADFRPMTDDNGIYVKHIEQNIDVNIRTRPINHLKRSYGPQTQPIQVSVNHPFMFFIIDRDLDVATMAGRILNPLNVRIQ